LPSKATCRGGKWLKSAYWQTQVPVDYIDTSLVINTWETVVADLSGGKPAKIWSIEVEQTNNGATDETIELEITINGTAYVFTRSCISGTIYFGTFLQLSTGTDFTPQLNASSFTTGATKLSANQAIPFMASSVGLIRVRQTTAVDVTSAQIEVNITWEKLVKAVL